MHRHEGMDRPCIPGFVVIVMVYETHGSTLRLGIMGVWEFELVRKSSA